MKKLLFVCSGGMDRSPTAAELFNDEKYIAKSCGVSPLISSNELTKEHLQWADKIFVMEPEHKRLIIEKFPLVIKNKPEIIVLYISNDYTKEDPELKKLLKERINQNL